MRCHNVEFGVEFLEVIYWADVIADVALEVFGRKKAVDLKSTLEQNFEAAAEKTRADGRT